MAKSDKKVEATPAEAEGQTGQGRAVVLPNGDRRIDYIRDQYYIEGVSRSDIKNAINAMLKEAKREDEEIQYQIVFSATKNTKVPGQKDLDPRVIAAKKAAAEAKAAPDAAADDAK